MNFEKLNPWNWFKHEEGGVHQQGNIPVTRKSTDVTPSSDGIGNLSRIHREMNNFFDEVFRGYGFPSVGNMTTGGRLSENRLVDVYRPQIDISGSEDQYEVTLDVPGLTESDLSIELQGDVLSIKGQKEEAKEEKDKHFYRVERSFGSFQRTLSLPVDAAADDLKATMKDGVLILKIPRHATEKKDVKRISISS